MEGLTIREDQGQGPPQDQSDLTTIDMMAVRFRSFEAVQASNQAFVAHLKEGAREAAQVMLDRAAETGAELQAALAACKLTVLQDICNRCSKFTGWNLVVTVKDNQIWFKDPNATGQSWLIVYLHPVIGLTEAYGRMRHWGITPEEMEVMRRVLSSDR